MVSITPADRPENKPSITDMNPDPKRDAEEELDDEWSTELKPMTWKSYILTATNYEYWLERLKPVLDDHGVLSVAYGRKPYDKTKLWRQKDK